MNTNTETGEKTSSDDKNKTKNARAREKRQKNTVDKLLFSFQIEMRATAQIQVDPFHKHMRKMSHNKM